MVCPLQAAPTVWHWSCMNDGWRAGLPAWLLLYIYTRWMWAYRADRRARTALAVSTLCVWVSDVCDVSACSVPAACSEVINGCWPEPLDWPLNKHYTSLRLMMMTMMQSKAHLPPRFQHLIKHARNDTVSLEVESERLRKMKCYSSNFFKSYNHEIFFTLPALKTVFSNSDVSFVRYIIYLVLDLLGSCPSTFHRLHLLTLFIHMTRQSILSHGLHKRLQAVSSLTRIWCMDILDISTCLLLLSVVFDLWPVTQTSQYKHAADCSSSYSGMCTCELPAADFSDMWNSLQLYQYTEAACVCAC